jgi:hypothetical protein
MFHVQEGAGSPSLSGDLSCFTFFTNDQCRMTNDRCLKGFLAARGKIGRFRGINPDFFIYKFFRCRDPLGALKRPFFCLPTHFLPLSDPFPTTFRPIFYRFLTHFLPFSYPLSTACRPSFYFSRTTFLAPETSLLLPRGPAREFIFFSLCSQR